MGIFGLIVLLVVLGLVVWLVQTYLPLPTPFKVIIQVVVVLFAIYLLLGFIGLAPFPAGHYIWVR